MGKIKGVDTQKDSNANRSRHYGIRIGDIAINRYINSGICEVIGFPYLDNNKVEIQDYNGVKYKSIAEHCLVLIPAEQNKELKQQGLNIMEELHKQEFEKNNLLTEETAQELLDITLSHIKILQESPLKKRNNHEKFNHKDFANLSNHNI